VTLAELEPIMRFRLEIPLTVSMDFALAGQKASDGFGSRAQGSRESMLAKSLDISTLDKGSVIDILLPEGVESSWRTALA